MKKVRSIHAAKTQLSRLAERACAGEQVVIARGKHRSRSWFGPIAKSLPAGSNDLARQLGA
jgi:hypothetical protein